MANFKKKILIDLDGVLNEYGKEPYDENFIPKIKEGAEDFIKELSEIAELDLFTSRNLMLFAKWLLENNLDKYFKDITNVKIPSYLYVDDRCVCFEGKYNETLNKIRNFKTYWK
ncbi:hypothetical protein IJ818_05250 [bacterium]|nr:hypothetical protein [bacterium]